MNPQYVLTPKEVGQSTLQKLSEAEALNQWMYESIRPYVNGRVLEIGSGIGNISEFFIRDKFNISLSDFDRHYCQLLQQKFGGFSISPSIYQIDFADKDFENVYPLLVGKFDTVFALNVVEHIQYDKLAILNATKLLTKGGHLILLVPAYQALYNILDERLEHYRRYNRKSIKKLLRNEFEIIKTRYFNLAGIFGWFFSGSILRRQTLPSDQLVLFNKLVPMFKLIDAITFQQIGLSVIAVGKKK